MNRFNCKHPVAVRLAGVGVFTITYAAKPDGYESEHAQAMAYDARAIKP
jgi:hypothetical protein